MNEVELVINGNPVIVRKLPLRKFADLLAAFEELPKHLDLIKGKTGDQIMQTLPQLIGVCYPDVVRVLQVATEMEPEQIDAMGLDDLVQIVLTIIEVNNIQKVYSNIKKITARQEVGSDLTPKVG